MDRNGYGFRTAGSGTPTPPVPPTLYQDITRLELLDLMTNDTVKIGMFYRITDSIVPIYTHGITTNMVDLTDCVANIKIPTIYGNGFFDANATYTAGDRVVWGGRIWENVIGNTGAALNKFELDSEWSVVPFSDAQYEDYYIGCSYDFGNDWITYGWDLNGNKLGCSYAVSQSLSLAYNPVLGSDWLQGNIMQGNECVYINNNTSPGIANNKLGAIGYITSNKGEIIDNSNKGEISFNQSDVVGNSNGGAIFNNAGTVENNSNVGSINSNQGIVVSNSNIGDIDSNLSDVVSNSNGGLILSNSNKVTSNTNGGVISNNTCAVSGNYGEGTIDGNTISGSISQNYVTVNINNNRGDGNIEDNIMTGPISNNEIASGGTGILHNRCGEISENIGYLEISANRCFSIESNIGSGKDFIVGNTCIGTISNNTATVSYNSNAGRIFENKVPVTYNSNNGNIEGIDSPATDVTHNTNNGDITISTAGSISDPIVNK